MNKPEVHNKNSTAATCAYNKEKNPRDLINKTVIGTKLRNEVEREKIISVKVINKPINTLTNSQLFQIQDYFPIPGTPKSSEPPVNPNTMMGSKKVSENSTHADTSEDEEENFPTDTPSLMLEISVALDGMSRSEKDFFSVDDSDSDSESQVDNTTPETVKPIEDGINDVKLTDIDEDDSDCDSVSTVEYTAPEPSKPTEEKNEDDKIIEIKGDDSDNDPDNNTGDTNQEPNEDLENITGVDKLSNENNDQNNDEGTVSNESNDQDNDEGTVDKVLPI